MKRGNGREGKERILIKCVKQVEITHIYGLLDSAGYAGWHSRVSGSERHVGRDPIPGISSVQQMKVVNFYGRRFVCEHEANFRVDGKIVNGPLSNGGSQKGPGFSGEHVFGIFNDENITRQFSPCVSEGRRGVRKSSVENFEMPGKILFFYFFFYSVANVKLRKMNAKAFFFKKFFDSESFKVKSNLLTHLLLKS